MAEAKKIDYANLEERLAELNAQAFQRAERACRIASDPTPDIVYSGNFRARLAAEALGGSYEELQKADLGTYTMIIELTLNFLLQNLGAEIQRKS